MKQENTAWAGQKGDLFLDFADQLCRWSRGGKLPEAADTDLRYVLGLQEKRLAAHGLKMEYKITPRGVLTDRNYAVTRKDAKYINEMTWRSCCMEITLTRGGKPVYRKKEKENLYVTITRLCSGKPWGAAPYCCPGCGSITRVQDLLETGCPYCGTRFMVTDFFPKVTNFYYIRDYGRTGREIKQELRKWFLGAGLFMTGFSLYNSAGDIFPGSGVDLGQLILALISGALGGCILGYFAYAISMLARLFTDAVKSMVILPSVMGTKRKLEAFVSQHDGQFSYGYFESQVLSLLKMILFSEDLTNLAVYDGPPVGDRFRNIVDVACRGGIGLWRNQVEGDYCRLGVNVYTTCLIAEGNGVRRRNKIFNLQLCKNVKNSTDLSFSVKRVQCRACGGSFDATRQKHCPYCDTAYDLRQDDWMMESIAML